MDRTELKYLQETPEGYEPPISVKSYGREPQHQEILRVYADEIEVEPPFGFDLEVDRARGNHALYPLKASSVDDQSTRKFLEAIDWERAAGRRVTVAREVDGEHSLFRLKRVYTEASGGTLSCELLEGHAMIYKRGQLVED